MDDRGHFRIAGVPVRVEWPFFLFAGALGIPRMRSFPGNRFLYILMWIGIVFVSVLVHELGHAIAYRVQRQRPRVVLTAFWGLTYGERSGSRWAAVAVSLAGPLAGFAILGLPAYHLYYGTTVGVGQLWVTELLYDVFYVNFVWSIANLLPILPLDGGNIATALFGLRAARISSVAAGAAVALWLFTIGQTYAAIAIGMLAVMSFAALRNPVIDFPDAGPTLDPRTPPHRERAGRRNRSAHRGPGSGTGRWRGLLNRRKRPALSVVPDPAETLSPPSVVDGPRLEASAWDALRRGDNGEAARLLLEATGRAGVSPHLPATLAAAEGRADDAVTLFERAFESAPTPPNLVAATVIGRSGIAERVAAELLGPVGPGPDPASTLQNHLHYAGCYSAAAKVGELLVADGRRSPAQSAFETACAWAQAGESQRALDWLSRAVDAGFRARSLIEGESDLAPVRALAGYAEVQARLGGPGL